MQQRRLRTSTRAFSRAHSRKVPPSLRWMKSVSAGGGRTRPWSRKSWKPDPRARAGRSAHDFSHRLAPLAAYPGLLRRWSREGEFHELLDELESAAMRIAGINQQLLAIGRRGHYEREPVDANTVLREALRLFWLFWTGGLFVGVVLLFIEADIAPCSERPRTLL